jgi:hypothetical protein
VTAANGFGDRRPTSQLCNASRVIGRPARLKTLIAWAWLSLFLTLHFLSCSITGVNSLGISTASSQMASPNASAEKSGSSSRACIVEIADGFEPSAKRELGRGPVDTFKEIDTLSRCLRGQSTLSELLNDGIRFEVEDGSMIAFDFEVGFIDQAEYGTSEEVCRKKVPASNLEKLGTVGLFDRYFDR